MPEMMAAIRSSTLSVLLLSIACIGGHSLQGRSEKISTDDYLGRRFICKDTLAARSCLSILQTHCQLSTSLGEGIPRELGENLILKRNGESVVVHGPKDMTGCVSITTGQDALEYARFFSSLKTIHLFTEQILEIYPHKGKDCYLVCLPPDRWSALDFTTPTFEQTASGYLVTRYVIRPISKEGIEAEIFKLAQMVTPDGNIAEVSSEPVAVPKEDLLWLGFPGYL